MPVAVSSQAIRPQPQDVYNHFARLSADQQLAVVLEFEARLDEERLRDAVCALIDAQPVLGCRFTCEGHAPRFMPGDRAAAFTVSDAPDLHSAVTEGASRLLDYSGGGVMHVGLFRGPGRDALVVRLDHTAADGQGAKQVASLLAGLYSGRTAGACSSGAGVPDRSAARLVRRYPLARRLALIRSRVDVRPTWGVTALDGEPGRRGQVMTTIPAADFSAVRRSAKSVGATVNDVLLAAFYRALFRELAPAEGRSMAVNVSFDMRRYLDADDPMPPASNLSSVETALVARIADETFADTLERTVAEMTRLKAGSPGLSSAMLMQYARLLGATRFERMVIEPMGRGRRYGVSFPFLSNFGVLESGSLTLDGTVPASAVILPPAGRPPFNMLGPSSFEG